MNWGTRLWSRGWDYRGEGRGCGEGGGRRGDRGRWEGRGEEGREGRGERGGGEYNDDIVLYKQGTFTIPQILSNFLFEIFSYKQNKYSSISYNNNYY